MKRITIDQLTEEWRRLMPKQEVPSRADGWMTATEIGQALGLKMTMEGLRQKCKRLVESGKIEKTYGPPRKTLYFRPVKPAKP
jgi:hypothetical protein